MDVVKLNLGETSMLICGVLQQLGLFGNAIAYTITSASSMRAIQKSICYKEQGRESYSCYMLIHKGVPALSAYDKVIKISLGLGDILYAYPFTSILLEIQDTLKSPPSETQTMKKATAISIYISTMFYLACGCFGYAAFGNESHGNLLSGSGFFEPHWLIDFANACVVIHIMGAYQVQLGRWFKEGACVSATIRKYWDWATGAAHVAWQQHHLKHVQVVYDALGLRYGGRHEKICCRTHSPSNVFCVDVLTSLLLLCIVLVSYGCMDCYFYYVLF